MQFNELLRIENIHCSVPCSSKKRALEIISELAASELSISAQEIFEMLLTREKMGTTAIGNGIAIPHARIENDATMVAYFLQLENGVDFESVDNQPIDLLFALFIPENKCKEHHEILSFVAKTLTDKTVSRRLRAAMTSEELYQIIMEKNALS